MDTSEPLPDRWSTRDLPALRWIVRHFDTDSHAVVGSDAIAEALGISHEEAEVAVRNLERGGYVSASWSFGDVSIGNITEKALREVGTWPNAETMADQLLWFLEQRVDTAPTPDERKRWERIRDSISGAGRDFAVELAAGIAAKSMGL